MNHKQLCALALAVLFASPVFGIGPARPDLIGRLLFQPDLIMESRNKLNLTEQQENTLKSELQNTQAVIFDLKWQLNEESEVFKAILQMVPVDEDQMLAQSDKVMQLEQKIKRAHLIMLVRLKNMLSEQQIKLLRELRRENRPKRPR